MDPASDQAAWRVDWTKRKSMTETSGKVVEHDYAAVPGTPASLERLIRLQARFRGLRKFGGQPTDKAFFDVLSGDR